jgi:GMP synthase (glutamine-hydrolysing)
VTEPHRNPADRRPLLIVEHARWEEPFRILDSFPDVPFVTYRILEDPETAPPPPSQVCGAVFMGGPMSVNDTTRFAGLNVETDWIRAAIANGTPVLGVCLGAQLIAKAAGALVAPGPAPEIGVSPVDILDPDDALLGGVAPSIPALHWHRDCFDLPAGAVALARSAPTPLQAFRIGTSAWGLLCHLEADRDVIDRWLAQPKMAAEARAALGSDFARLLRAQAEQLEPARAQQVFDAFAVLCAQRSASTAVAGRPLT